MRWCVIRFFLLLLFQFQEKTNTTAAQRMASTIKIGKMQNRSNHHQVGRGNSGIKIGEGSKLLNNISRINNNRPILTTSMNSTNIPLSYASQQPPPPSTIEFTNGTKLLKIGLSVPYKSFGSREYTKAVSKVVNALQKSTKRPNLSLFQHYDIYVKVSMQELTPSPMSEAI